MQFKPMTEVVPQGSVGLARVEHFEVTRQGFRADAPPPGNYAKLIVGGRLYMSDTPFEKRTNWGIVHHANGHVLIAGLGLGMILTAILDKPAVQSVTVIEKYQDVIDLVAPHHLHPKLTVICADIFEWKPEKGTKYDTIYFDIWPDICTDSLKEMETLHRRFARILNRENHKAWMDSWQKDYLRYQRRRERASGW